MQLEKGDMPTSRSVQQGDHRACEKFLYELQFTKV
jgi:hypothetical protein